MSSSTPSSSTFKPEKTFRSFDAKQGAHYAAHRRNYHPNLYEILINHHTSTGGQLETLVDVGCGPGQAVRSLAPRFAHAYGLDPSEGMITTARSFGGSAANSEPIRFEISTAEELGSNLSDSIPDGSVDLITSATAAHWFDMSGFWPRAAQILKPGGSVAFWCSGSVRFDTSKPEYAAIQAAIDSHEELLKDYMVPGNIMARELYINLPLPWTIDPPVLEFDKDTFLRKEWGTGEDSEPNTEFFAYTAPINLDTLELVLSTSSPVQRWREAHPEDVGTERDVVRQIRMKIEKILRDAGVQIGEERIEGGITGVMLIVKKKAA